MIASIAMLTAISGTAMRTPFLILVFPIIGVPTFTTVQAVGMALFTEFFGFLSGWIGYSRAGLIDYKTGRRLAAVGVPVIVFFSLIAHYVPNILLKGFYEGMMIALATYLSLTAVSNVRNRELNQLPPAVEQIPRVDEAPLERVVRPKRGTENRYKVCDQSRGYIITSAGCAMEGMVSVSLGEVLMPNLVKRCKIPVAVSAATSVFVIAITVLSGSITSILALLEQGAIGAVHWGLVAYAAPGAVIGGQLGSRFQGRLSATRAEQTIAVSLCCRRSGFSGNGRPLVDKIAFEKDLCNSLTVKSVIQFKCKDFLLKECELEIKGTHSVDEMMKLVDVHLTEAHRTLKLSPETREKIRRSIRDWSL